MIIFSQGHVAVVTLAYLSLDMEKGMSSNHEKWQENAPEEVGKPSKLIDKELSNEESGGHDCSWMILFPDLDMNMVL